MASDSPESSNDSHYELRVTSVVSLGPNWGRHAYPFREQPLFSSSVYRRYHPSAPCVDPRLELIGKGHSLVFLDGWASSCAESSESDDEGR